MTLTRILTTWLALAVIMTANGIFRELVLKPRFAESTAEWISLAVGVVVILVVTRIGFRIPPDYPVASLLLVGAFLVALTVIFEFAVGMFLDDTSFTELAGAYAFWRGEPWPFVLLLLGLTPLIWRGRS